MSVGKINQNAHILQMITMCYNYNLNVIEACGIRILLPYALPWLWPASCLRSTHSVSQHISLPGSPAPAPRPHGTPVWHRRPWRI